jgi:hypothetical protein
MPARNHHTTSAWPRTAPVVGEQRQQNAAQREQNPCDEHAGAQPPQCDPGCDRPGLGGPAPAEGVADQRLRGDGVRVEHQGEEEEELERDLVGTQLGGTGPGGDPRGDEEGQLEDRRPQEQVPADDQLAQYRGPTRLPADPLSHESADEQGGGQRLAGHVGERRPAEAEADRMDEHRAEDQAEQASGEHVADRAVQVPDTAKPAVARL